MQSVSQKSEKYGFSDRTQGGQIWFLQGAGLSWKMAKKAKGPNENYGASNCYSERNFSNLSPKGATLMLQLARVDEIRVDSW